LACKSNQIKSKYKFMEFFADVIEVTPSNMSRVLKSILPQSDVEYLFKSHQILMTELAYRHACVKLGKVMHNDVKMVNLHRTPREEPHQIVEKQHFAHHLASYAYAVTSRSGI